MRPCKLHLGRKVSIYAFCGTLAAKVILINCEYVFPSGNKGVARTAGVSTSFYPPRYGFGRTGMLLVATVQAQASRPIELGAALFSNVHSLFMTLFPLLETKYFCCRSQQKTPFGRTLPFLTKWFPPLSRGWHCPQGVLPAR